MSAVEHTATPWRADAPRTFAGVRWDCIIRGNENSPVCLVIVAGFAAKEAEANAAFIVRAANSHDAMRSCLEWLDRKGGLGLDVHERIRDVLRAPDPAAEQRAHLHDAERIPDSPRAPGGGES